MLLTDDKLQDGDLWWLSFHKQKHNLTGAALTEQ